MVTPTTRAPADAREGRFGSLRIPSGWFPVADSEDLAPGDVKPLHYFGRELVLFRTAEGAPQVLDAYCAHLGAHLGFGGMVVDECIRCPFHAWHYDLGGRVVQASYANRVPTASVRAWPTVERCGFVFVWHQPDGDAPAWDLPDLPEHPRGRWAAVERYRYVIKTHPQEIAENTFDCAHGQYVHSIAGNTADPPGPPPAYSFEALVAESRSPGSTFRHYGLGISLLSGFAGDLPLYERIAGTTPIDDESVDVRYRIYPAVLDDPLASAAARKMTEYLGVGVNEDIPIWEHKIYRERPRLADRDGPIMQFRRWAQQFYDETTD